jgi:hypothetical protein
MAFDCGGLSHGIDWPLVAILIVALIVWVIETLLPLPAPFQTVIRVIAVIIVLLLLVQFLGVLGVSGWRLRP